MFKPCSYFVFFLFIIAVHGWRSYNILFNNITTYSDAKLLEMNATVRPNNQTADLYINVHNVLPLHNITFEILISPPSENGYTTLLKRSMTICEFTMGKYVDPIVKLIYDEFKKINVQFLSKCPIPVGLYRIDGFTVDTEKLPPYLPDAVFKCILTAYYIFESKRNILYTIEANCTVDSSSSWKRIKMMAKKNKG